MHRFPQNSVVVLSMLFFIIGMLLSCSYVVLLDAILSCSLDPLASIVSGHLVAHMKLKINREFLLSHMVSSASIVSHSKVMTFSGTVNIHPSLLPLYRGAAPVQRALQVF